MQTASSFNFISLVSDFVHLLLAFLLALPIGWEREIGSKSAGLRTFPLVAVGACGYMLIGINILENNTEAQSRVIYGIITGIGFIGGGAIIKSYKAVSGTATAASIWNTGAIGMAIALDNYEIALFLAFFNYITLRYASILKNRFTKNNQDHF